MEVEGEGTDGGVATDGDRDTTEISRSRISVFDFSTLPLYSFLFYRYYSLYHYCHCRYYHCWYGNGQCIFI